MRADLTVRPDRNLGDVEGGEPCVDEGACTDCDVAAVVKVDRWPHVGSLAEAAEQLASDLLRSDAVLVVRREEHRRHTGRALLLLEDLGIVRDVEVAGLHAGIVAARVAGEVVAGLRRTRPVRRGGVGHSTSISLMCTNVQLIVRSYQPCWRRRSTAGDRRQCSTPSVWPPSS